MNNDMMKLMDQLIEKGDKRVYKTVMQDAERGMLTYALVLAKGNKSKAADLIGMHKDFFRQKCQAYKIVFYKVPIPQ